tara:strand:+ start:1159 stop:1779 length:621 start_codon:yes stop_codon:yes gene_type:complete
MREHKLDNDTLMGAWFMPKKLCNDITKKMDKSALVPGMMYNTGSGQVVDKNAKESFEMAIHHFENDEPWKTYKTKLYDILKLYIKKYPDIHNNAEFGLGEPFNTQKYPIGGGFKIWHYENDFQTFNYDRCLVFMTYLNDVEDGGTSFKYQGIDIPAKKGLTLIWPAYWTHTHRGIISKTKEKYIVTGWLNFINHRKKQIKEGTVKP